MTHRAITMEHPAVPLDSFRPSNNYPIAAQRKSARHNQGMRNAKLHGIPARKEDDQNWIESRPTAVSHLLGSLVALMFRCKNDSFVADCIHRFWPCRCHQVVGWLDLAQKYQERNRTWMNLISDLINKKSKVFTSPRHVARPNSLAAWRSRSGISTLERIKTIL